MKLKKKSKNKTVVFSFRVDETLLKKVSKKCYLPDYLNQAMRLLVPENSDEN